MADPSDPTDETASAPAAADAALASEPELSAKRREMLDLVARWMPTTLSDPQVPDGETEDLFARAGWTRAMGQQFFRDKQAGKPVTTSCGDILHQLLLMWRSTFVGAFMIRDCDAKGHPPGAKKLGYYVDADGTSTPRPGDILVLRNGVGHASAGSVGHVGILVEATDTVWRTADGGGGLLPDQHAGVTERSVRLGDDGIPILRSPTDGREKQLDGWIDLDRLEQQG